MSDGLRPRPAGRRYVRTILTMVVREGCEEPFEAAWAASTAAIGGQPGQLGQALMREVDQPRHYVLTGDWESLAALRAFEGSAARAAFSASVEPLRESARKAVVEVIDHVGPTEEVTRP